MIVLFLQAFNMAFKKATLSAYMRGISLRCRHMPVFICIAYSSVITIKISFNINNPPIPCFISTSSFKEKKQATRYPREYSGDNICTLINCMLTTQLSSTFSFVYPFLLKPRFGEGVRITASHR